VLQRPASAVSFLELPACGRATGYSENCLYVTFDEVPGPGDAGRGDAGQEMQDEMQGRDAGQTKQPPINRDNGANGGYFGHGRDSYR
jgi:hypothetical protein